VTESDPGTERDAGTAPAAAPRRRRLSPLALGAALLAAVGAAYWLYGAWVARGFVEYRMPDRTDIPTAVAVAPDGTVWLTIEFSDAIGVLRNGRIEKIRKGHQSFEPLGLAIDARGAAWYTDGPQRTVARVAPEGTITAFTLSTPVAKLARLAVAPDGAVWFAEETAFSLTRLKDGVFTRHEVGSLAAAPFGVAVGSDGTVWGTLPRANRLVRLPPGGPPTELDVPTRGSQPGDVAVDARGAVWFLEMRANKIGRYAEGRFSEFPVPRASPGLTAVAVAPDGAVWFTELRAHRLGRLRDGVVTEFALPRRDARPFGVAVDPAGNVWYTDLSGWLGRLAAERARVR
jgi:virginiamycin B lyase